MGYTNAGVVLPDALIREIQRYVNGISLYIPQVKRKKTELNPYRQEIRDRNREIYRLFREGNSVSILSESFFLSEKSIYRIVSQMKR